MWARHYQRLDALAEKVFHTGGKSSKVSRRPLRRVQRRLRRAFWQRWHRINQRAHIDIDGGGGVSHLADIGVCAGTVCWLCSVSQLRPPRPAHRPCNTPISRVRPLVGFVGNHHKQHVGAHVAPVLSAASFMRAAVRAAAGCCSSRSRIRDRRIWRRIPSRVALPGADHFIGTDGCGLTRQSFMVKVTEIAFGAQRSRRTCVFGQVVVATQ